MDEANHLNTIIVFCAAIIFFVLILYTIVSLARRKAMATEDKLRLIEKERQIDLFKATARAEENQKLKIAAQLHDEVIPQIILAGEKIEKAVSEMKRRGCDVDELTNEIRALPHLQETIRSVIHEIVPDLLTSFGLLKAIEVYIRQINIDSKQVAAFRNNTAFSGELPFTTSEQLLIFKVCRELINNLRNHAKYDYLTVTLEEAADFFTILFSHNGLGITNERIDKFRELAPGMGLKLLESRLIALSASIDYFTDSDVSYIKLKIPVKNVR